jgi:dCMP deaminase
MGKRISFDEYFMKIAILAAERSTCLRRKVGALLVKDKQIIATGYNGAPKGAPHCDEKNGCLRQELNIPSGQRHEICRASHAEGNAIAQAARYGVAVEGATIYVKNLPCVMCAKQIINSGVKEIVYADDYGDSKSNKLTKELLKESRIKVRKLEKA